MAIVAPIAPPALTPLPSPPSTSDPANFDPRADAFLGALPINGAQMNSLGSNVYTNAVRTYNSATDAATAANAAVPAATQAGNSASIASTSLATMQKLYLGAKTEVPFVDNQGNALELGAWYTNTTTGFWYWWSGSGWRIGVSDLSMVDWTTQVTGKPDTTVGYGITDAVTLTGAQTVTGVKNFVNGTVSNQTSSNISNNLRYSANLSTANTNWYTVCVFSGPNAVGSTRFTLVSNDYFACEITFSHTVHGQRGAQFSYKVLGAYGFWWSHPYKFRVVAIAENTYRLEMCFQGQQASTAAIQVVVHEQFISSGTLTFPFTTAPATTGGANTPNCVQVGNTSGFAALTCQHFLGATYYQITASDGSVGQNTATTNLGTTG